MTITLDAPTRSSGSFDPLLPGGAPLPPPTLPSPTPPAPSPTTPTARRSHRRLRALTRAVVVAITVVAVGAIARAVGLPSIVAVTLGVGAGLVARRWLFHGRERRTTFGRFVLFMVVLVAMSATSWSFTGALTDTGAAPVSDRTANWMRDHHMNLIVDTIEQRLDNRNATNGAVNPGSLPNAAASTPASSTITGGPAPSAATIPTTTAATPVDHTPPPAGPLIDTTLFGEGQWTPNTREANGVPTTYTTFVRPDPDHTGVVAAAVEFDPSATRLVYVPGTRQPGGAGWAWGSGIPIDQRPSLVAAFNSGWKHQDDPGGAYTEGRTASDLIDGRASLVIYADGHNDIGAWGNDVAMTPDVVSVRQNLDLVVVESRPVDGLTTGGSRRWGSEKHQTQYTRRSGLGVTSDGALVYVAGNGLTTATLADALVQVGAVRAMELDIHNQHPTFNFFTPAPGTPDGVTGEPLLPDQVRPSTRYLAPDQRDFFAVLVS